MSDIQRLFDTISHAARDTRGDYHMTLGGMVDALSGYPADMPIRLDTGGAPGKPGSYRGYYSDLALSHGELDTVSKLLSELRRALGATFTGYKGGDFFMDEKTPLWVSEYGEVSGVAVMGLAAPHDTLLLITRKID